MDVATSEFCKDGKPWKQEWGGQPECGKHVVHIFEARNSVAIETDGGQPSRAVGRVPRHPSILCRRNPPAAVARGLQSSLPLV